MGNADYTVAGKTRFLFFFYINYICTATFGGTKGYLGPEDFFHFFVAFRPCLAHHHMSIRGLRTELRFLALPGKSSARSLAFSYWFYFSKSFLTKWIDLTQLTWCNLKKTDEVCFRKNYTCSNQPFGNHFPQHLSFRGWGGGFFFYTWMITSTYKSSKLLLTSLCNTSWFWGTEHWGRQGGLSQGVSHPRLFGQQSQGIWAVHTHKRGSSSSHNSICGTHWRATDASHGERGTFLGPYLRSEFFESTGHCSWRNFHARVPHF